LLGERGSANAQCEPCSNKLQLGGLVTPTRIRRFVLALGYIGDEPMRHFLEQEAIEVCKEKLQRALTQAIVTAYLITGSTGRSEAAVMEAIERWEPNKGVKSLLELVAGLAVKYEGGPRDEWPLRGELQNVVQLPRNARRSFVLRILLGVPREVCTKLLDLNTDEVDHQTCEALVALGTRGFREEKPHQNYE
jgi:hypothetical protein